MAYIQKATSGLNGGTATATATFASAVTAGNGLVVVIAQSGTGADRTYTVSNGGDTFSAAVSLTPSRGVYVYSCPASAGGMTTVSATINTGAPVFEILAFEVAALDSGVAPVTSSFSNTAATTHYCGESGGITTAGASFIVTASALGSNVSGQTKNASFDGGQVGNAAGTPNVRYFQWLDHATTVSGIRGEWTHSGSGVGSTNVIAAFRYAEASAPPTSGGAGGRHSWFGR